MMPVLAHGEQAATDAFGLHEQACRYLAMGTACALKLGAVLAELRDSKLYKALGYDTFEDYLNSQELAAARRSAYRYMQAARAQTRLLAAGVAEEPDIANVGTSKLALIEKAVTLGSDDDAGDWYHRALTLSESDLRAELREKTGSDPIDEDAELLAQQLRTAARKIETPHADKDEIVRALAWHLLGRMADTAPDAAEQLDTIAAWAVGRRGQMK